MGDLAHEGESRRTIRDGYGVWHPGRRTFLYAVPRGIRGRFTVWWRQRVARRAQRRPSIIDDLPLLAPEGRAYVVFSSSLEAGQMMTEWPWVQSPNIWWPADRAWRVATDIDFDSTVVGGSRDLVDRILTSPELEALEVTPEDRLDHLGDEVNDTTADWAGRSPRRVSRSAAATRGGRPHGF